MSQEQNDVRLEEVLADYLQAEESGQAPDRKQLLAQRPDLAEELTTFFECRQQVPRLWPSGLPQESPACIGDFTIEETLGQGAMGVVYKARQKQLPSLVVALKWMRASQRAGAENRSRFITGAEALAHLRHPNIVTIYQAGEHDGIFFYAMELMEGGSLAQRLREQGPLPPRAAAQLVCTLARAMQHAHQQHLVHRDLKPANILLTANGDPKIADFDLAQDLDGEITRTDSGALVGTIPYMAPEQAAGQIEAIGPWTDIYALGAILYELLTGRPPFLGANWTDTLEQIRHQEPVPPHLLNPKVDDQLETICLQCLQKDPTDRLAAQELVEDLECSLNHLPNRHARPPSWLDFFKHLLSEPRQIADFTHQANLNILAGFAFALANVSVFFLLHYRGPEPLLWMVLFSPYAVLIGANLTRPESSHSSVILARRHLLSIWIGHGLGCASFITALRWMTPDYVTAFLMCYPAMSVLTGLALFAMGALFWGRFFLTGLVWIGFAPVMALEPTWAPLEAAFLAAMSGSLVGLTMRRLVREKKSEQNPFPRA